MDAQRSNFYQYGEVWNSYPGIKSPHWQAVMATNFDSLQPFIYTPKFSTSFITSCYDMGVIKVKEIKKELRNISNKTTPHFSDTYVQKIQLQNFTMDPRQPVKITNLIILPDHSCFSVDFSQVRVISHQNIQRPMLNSQTSVQSSNPTTLTSYQQHMNNHHNPSTVGAASSPPVDQKALQDGVVLGPGDVAEWSIRLELIDSNLLETRGVIRSLVLAELEVPQFHSTKLGWTIFRCVVGTDLQAVVTDQDYDVARLRIDAVPFFPTEFKRLFDVPASLSLPPSAQVNNVSNSSSLHLIPYRYGTQHNDVNAALINGANNNIPEIIIPPQFKVLGAKIILPPLFTLAENESFLNLTEQKDGESEKILNYYGFNVFWASDADPWANYKNRMKKALVYEENQMLLNLRNYDLYSLILEKTGSGVHHFKIHVPSLSERKPPLVYGDLLRLRPISDQHSEFLCVVIAIDILNCKVVISVPNHSPLLSMDLQRTYFHARFTLGHQHGAMQKMHQALDTASDALLARIHGSVYSDNMTNQFSAKNLSVDALHLSDLNPEQLEAVAKCLTDRDSNGGVINESAYVIWGPPGTGKTKVVVSLICEMLSRNPNARILATAPSQSAADMLAERLILMINQIYSGVDKSARPQLFRLNPYERQINEARVATLQYVRIDPSTALFDIFPLAQLVRFNVIVTTCASASWLVEAGMKSSSFDLVAVDEAAQSLEPEILIPFQLASERTKIVLCGDNKQLTGSVRSKKAKGLGLGMVLMDRLMRDYDRNSSFIIKLRRNYRSHQSILEVPSKLFYDSSLLACGDQAVTHSMIGWKGLHGSSMPILFYGVQGTELRPDERSPSVHNPLETNTICELIRELLDSKLVTSNDIGVIAPYRLQVYDIRQLLRSNNLGSIRVGNVEDYQGQEEKIVMISTVVSSIRTVEYEKDNGIGLCGSPKNFNVAVTRAKALLIVVGNPYVLEHDMCWRELLELCIRQNTYRGCSYHMQSQSSLPETGDFERLLQNSSRDEVAKPPVAYDSGASRDDVNWRIIL